MSTPTPLSDDDGTPFVKGADGLFYLTDRNQFLSPDDERDADDEPADDPSSLNYFPRHLKLHPFWSQSTVGMILNFGMQPIGCSQIDPERIASECEEEARNLRKETGGADTLPAGFALAEEMELLARSWRQAMEGSSPELSGLVEAKTKAAILWLQLAHRLHEDAVKGGDSVSAESALGDLEDRLTWQIGWLCRLVEAGDHGASDFYLELLTAMIELIRRNGASFEPLMRLSLRWPALVSRHPFYARHNIPPEGLGLDYPFAAHEGSRWTPDNPLTLVAIHLFLYTHRLNQQAVKFLQSHGLGNDALEGRLRPAATLGALPASAPEWWSFAREAFLTTYPAPETNEQFRDWVTGESHQKSPGRVRARILEKLRDAFFSVAGHNKSRRA